MQASLGGPPPCAGSAIHVTIHDALTLLLCIAISAVYGRLPVENLDVRKNERGLVMATSRRRSKKPAPVGARNRRSDSDRTPNRENNVLTPGGWRPESKVHILQDGQHISGKGGRLRIIETATGRVVKDLGPTSKKKRPEHLPQAAAKPQSRTVPAITDKGWIENSQWHNSGAEPIVYFSTTWVVPPVPSSDDDQILFLFNGLQPDDGSHILQPVLQWGAANGTGKIWSITNWYANGEGGSAITKTPIQVNPGDVLQGLMTLTAYSGSDYSYHCSFVGHSSVDIDANDVDELTWAFETLEAYGSGDETKPVPNCADYPATPLTAFYDIEIKTGSSAATGTDATLDWSPVTRFTDCGQQVAIVSNASPGGIVYLYYRTLAPTLYFVVDKSTFGVDEVTDALQTMGGDYKDCFWVILEGFTPNQLGTATVTLGGDLLTFSDIDSITQDGPPVFENDAAPDLPQRIRFAFNIQFKSTTAFPTGSPAYKSITAGITVSGTSLSATTEITLVAGADPYFTNVDPDNNVFYLSQDLRVFSAASGASVLGGPTFSSDPYASIQSLLGYLNTTDSFTVPSATDPLNNLPGQSGYETADSSVTPLNGAGQKNNNFALARVRLRDAAGASAADVRVFFRLFVAQSCDTDFQPTSTYQTITDAAGSIVPIQSATTTDPSGQTLQTIPFFATGSADSDYDGAMPNGNIQTIHIPAGDDSVWKYFGCFLDVYDSSNQSKFPGTHHCVVAEIKFSGTPIVNAGGVTQSPESSDKLAQRNLQITSSGNPSYPSTHRIPQTFDTRPTGAPSGQTGGLNYPDELMIDWGDVPAGSVASIFWPQVNVQDVLLLARKTYSTTPLAMADVNTLTCAVTNGVTYVPIPEGVGENFAGLFTVDLPKGISIGQEFNLKVRRIVSRAIPAVVTIAVSKRGVNGRRALESVKATTNWRYVTGTFQVKIPVARDDVLLRQEENTLAILKWRQQAMSPAYRWYPVVERLIAYSSQRVAGFGGDPSAVGPSPLGFHPPVVMKQEGDWHDGKICEVQFNCFGDFEGFTLEICSGKEHFRSHERPFEEICLRACKERLLVSVCTDKRGKIQSMIIRSS
jgi:hypothetical protein